MECLGYLLLKLTIFMIPQCISILKTFLRHFFPKLWGSTQILSEKSKKVSFSVEYYILFVVLLHNIQLQSHREAQLIGYLIRRKICQSQ